VVAGAPAEQVAGALRSVVLAGPRTAGAGSASAATAQVRGPGTLLAVWGPAGAPGRTTIALGLADAFARRGLSTLLLDADPYGGSVATLTGLLDEAPGLAAACRAANAGRLDISRLAECCRTVGGDLRVLTGLSDPPT
jgi:Mrp family chromosome partitioning ATPase